MYSDILEITQFAARQEDRQMQYTDATAISVCQNKSRDSMSYGKLVFEVE